MNIRGIDIHLISGAFDSIVDGRVSLRAQEESQAQTINETAIRKIYRALLSQDGEILSVSVLDFDLPFSFIASAKILAQEILHRIRSQKRNLQQIDIYYQTADEKQNIEKYLLGYLTHITQNLSLGPYVTVDIIIEVPEGLVIIERSNPPFGWALPGGFLDYGETLEEAAHREAKEETNLILQDLKQFHTYSSPLRDPRFQTVTTVFTAKGIGIPCAGDDAKNLKVFSFDEIRDLNYAFDHRDILETYLKEKGL